MSVGKNGARGPEGNHMNKAKRKVNFDYSVDFVINFYIQMIKLYLYKFNITMPGHFLDQIKNKIDLIMHIAFVRIPQT